LIQKLIQKLILPEGLHKGKYAMSQGRNGTSRESVNDILHVLSERDIIDVDLMTHYLHRLGEEWIEGGAREQVLCLLRSKESRSQAAAIRVLTKLATDADLECLEDFVTDPTVSDMPKLSLAPILKSLNSEMADDGLLEYLNDGAGAVRQMQSHLLDLAGKNMLGIETILNDFRSMPEERQLGFIAWLGNSGDPRAAYVLVPLLDLTAYKLVVAVIEALEALGGLSVAHTIPALRRFLGSTYNRQLKDLARATLHRLTVQLMIESEEFMLLDRRFSFGEYEARVSPLDSTGNQLIMLSWFRSDLMLQGVNLLISAGYGLKDCYSIDEISCEQWDSLVEDFQAHGYSGLKVSFDYARALAIEAYGQKKRLRGYLPLTYSLWRPLIEGSDSREKKKRLIASLVTVKHIPSTQLDSSYALNGGGLLELPEFSFWFYDPLNRIVPYITRYMELFPQNFNIAQPEQLQLDSTQEQELAHGLDLLVEEALEDLIDTEWRLTYESLLRRQAAFFQQTGRDRVARVIEGVAAALHPESTLPLRQQTFPQALLRLSLKHGPLRLMLEALRSERTIVPFAD
jgi:hypothetical protein